MLLVAGCWKLETGNLKLDDGCSLLVTGYWVQLKIPAAFSGIEALPGCNLSILHLCAYPCVIPARFWPESRDERGWIPAKGMPK
jgi:hypothetical protein